MSGVWTVGHEWRATELERRMRGRGLRSERKGQGVRKPKFCLVSLFPFGLSLGEYTSATNHHRK